jgi:hypothetical protein
MFWHFKRPAIGIRSGAIGIRSGAIGIRSGVIGIRSGVIGGQSGVIGGQSGVIGGQSGAIGGRSGSDWPPFGEEQFAGLIHLFLLYMYGFYQAHVELKFRSKRAYLLR